jgi:hypothetical protein
MNSDAVVPFRRFIESVRSARASDYLSRPGSAVLDAAAFEAMRSYILRYYEKRDAVSSVVDGAGAVFDCIPVAQQIGLRDRAASEAAPPDAPSPAPEPGVPPAGSASTAASAPPGTIPVRRITLEDLVRFPTLEAFFGKDPTSRGRRDDRR